MHRIKQKQEFYIQQMIADQKTEKDLKQKQEKKSKVQPKVLLQVEETVENEDINENKQEAPLLVTLNSPINHEQAPHSFTRTTNIRANLEDTAAQKAPVFAINKKKKCDKERPIGVKNPTLKPFP